jgi:hypothetical protein
MHSSGDPGSAIVLTLYNENGTVAGTADDPPGVDGNAYFVGTNHVFFIDGTTVKALGRNGAITTAGSVPQPSTTLTAEERNGYVTFAVSPDESTLLFGIPLTIAGDEGTLCDHSELWTEPVGGSVASAVKAYDYFDGIYDTTLLPFAWTAAGAWVSATNTTGLGGAGPFISYRGIDPMKFDASSHALAPLSGTCDIPDAAGAGGTSDYVCAALSIPPTLEVVLASGTKTVAASSAGATAFGSYAVSPDGRYLFYGAYDGTFGSGHYVTTIVDLSSSTTVATVDDYVPMQWLADDRLVVSNDYNDGSTYLLSPTFTSPTRISADQPTGVLP